MAIITSSVWSTARGSIGGTTYTANGFHSIIARARVAPQNVFTAFTAAIKSAMAGAEIEWKRLTKTVQTNWDIWAQTVIYSGPSGTYTIPGRQAFIAGRTIQNYVGTRGLAVPSFVTTAPLITGFLLPFNIAAVAPSAPGTGVAFQISADVNDDTLVHASLAGPFESTRNFYRGPWRSGDAEAAIVPQNTSTIIDFLGLVVGKVYFMRLKCVSDDASPRTSAEYILRAVAVVVGP